MKLLITGNKGHLGSAYQKAVEDEHTIIGFDLPEDNLAHDDEKLARCIDEVDMVVHIGAIADLNESMAKQYYNYMVNVEATFYIAWLCQQMGKKLIFISTCCVYGNTKDSISTEDITMPVIVEPYTASKMAAESVIKGMTELDYVIVRPGTIYGVNMRKALFTYIALDRISKDQTVLVHGTGLQTRQYICIDDLVAGLVKVTDRFDRLAGQVFNLCGVEHHSVLDVITVCEQITGKVAEVDFVPGRVGEIMKENISISKAQVALDWEPKTKFSAGMWYVYKHDKRFADEVLERYV